MANAAQASSSTDAVEFCLNDDLKVFYVVNPADESDPSVYRYSDEKALVILRGYLRDETSIEDAARALVDLLPSLEEERERGGAEKELFGSFLCQMGEQIPYNHPYGQARLVQLIKLLSVSPKLGMITNGRLGSEYPGFYSLQAMHISIIEETVDVDLNYDSFPGDRFAQTLNFWAFIARLSGQAGLDDGGLLKRTTEAMAGGLELEDDNGDPKYQNCCICIAALWVILAGPAVYSAVVEAPPSRDETGSRGRRCDSVVGGRRKGMEVPEFGIERWRFWKAELKNAGKSITARADDKGERTELTRKLATGAFGVMDAIEKSMQV